MITFRRHKNRLLQLDPAPDAPGIPGIDTSRARAGRPRILILSASCGAGHVRAAEAVQLALGADLPRCSALANVDAMNFTNSAFRRFYSRTYFDLVDKAPHLIGYLYDKTDRRSTWPRLHRMRGSVQKMNMRRLVKFIVDGRWDLAVSTHFLPAEIIASLRLAGKVDVPQATVTTDFDTHHVWFNDPCELFFTASEEAKANLATCGVPPGNIRVTGIPIHPAFAEPKSVAECRRRHGLSFDRPVVLQQLAELEVPDRSSACIVRSSILAFRSMSWPSPAGRKRPASKWKRSPARRCIAGRCWASPAKSTS